MAINKKGLLFAIPFNADTEIGYKCGDALNRLARFTKDLSQRMIGSSQEERDRNASFLFNIGEGFIAKHFRLIDKDHPIHGLPSTKFDTELEDFLIQELGIEIID